MKRKLIAVLLAAAMTVSLAACGGGNLRKNDTDMIHSILCRQYLVDVDFFIFG